jgi:RNA-directed DNA polymerase
MSRGYTDVVDADLSGYFDTIPHDALQKSAARRIVDGQVLRLIKLWLKAPIEERDGDGTRRMRGGKKSSRGTPQGGVVSPLLANIYMNRFLKYWRLCRCGDAFQGYVVAYADDFVILSRGRAGEAMAWTRAVMTRLGLTLNEVKTTLKDARKDRFDFLGYTFGPHVYKGNGQRYLSASPSKRSVQRLKTKVRGLLATGNHDPWPEVRDQLNSMLLGWSGYFRHGTRRSAFRGLDHFVYERVRDFLVRRHKVAGRGSRRFSCEIIYGKHRLLCLERLP